MIRALPELQVQERKWERILPRRWFSRTVWRNLRTGAEAMDVQLTSDQKAFARHAVETGRLHSEEDAVEEALALWEERERRRVEFLSSLDEARASLARGEGRAITPESMRELSAEVKERGRARLIAELAHTG
jgi:Arc/MetJ-type ribon-helix-helix transcriptional regulator